MCFPLLSRLSLDLQVTEETKANSGINILDGPF